MEGQILPSGLVSAPCGLARVYVLQVYLSKRSAFPTVHTDLPSPHLASCRMDAPFSDFLGLTFKPLPLGFGSAGAHREHWG